MFDRLASHLDLPSIPIPDSDLVGFNGYRDCVECWPVYRVTQAERDDLNNYWPRRKAMAAETRLNVVRRELKDVINVLDGIVGDEGLGVYTQEFRDKATRVAVKVHEAIAACDGTKGEPPY